LNKDERKRLEKLQEDTKKGKLGGTFSGDANITAFDLHLLLLEDATTRNLIRDICKKALKKTSEVAPEDADADETDQVAADESDDETQADHHSALALAKEELDRLRQSLMAEQVERKTAQTQVTALEKEVRKLKSIPTPAPVAPPDGLRGQLAPELALLKAVQADTELAQVWLHTDVVGTENEARQLVRLLAVMGDWDELQALWTRLADRCKNDRRPATANEYTVLQTALALHNLRYRNRAAQLAQVAVGSAFHHETMERGTPKGSTVQAVWLPGLLNAAGSLQKQTLVQTDV
jgi:hypothetical protein